uniref:Ig-like domain-containing protein n=1 Tax=Magallana gigas TaxID=29159 RepID=A0A8W8I0S6_MAGGI
IISTQFHNYQSAAVIPPSFNPTRRNVTYHVGETALLECSVDNLGTKEVIWKNRNQKHVITVGSFVFVGNGAYSVSHPSNSPHYDLVIKNVQRHHAGVYECQVSTREVMSIDIQLNVIDPPANKHRYSSPPTASKPAASKNRERAVNENGGETDDRSGRQAEQKNNNCSLLTIHFPTFVLLSTLSSILVYLPR